MEIKYTGKYKPEKQTPQSAGYDIRIDSIEYFKGDVIIINPNNFKYADSIKIKTDLAIELSECDYIETKSGRLLKFEYKADLSPRSGISNHGWILGNCEGKIDADYRGEIMATFWRVSTKPFPYKQGERFAQLIINTALCVEFNEVKQLSETLRDVGGHGHTGNK